MAENSEVDIMENHAPDLSGCTSRVKERFDEASEIAEQAEDIMYFLDGMEEAMVGTMTNSDGITVPVYERRLCIECIKKNYGDHWMDEPAYGYTAEQKKDAGFLESELESMATEDFEYNTLRSLPYLHEHAPVIIEGFMVDAGHWDKMRMA